MHPVKVSTLNTEPLITHELKLVRVSPAADHAPLPLPEYVLHRDDYTVQRARTPAQRLKAKRLVERMYSARGYTTEASRLPAHEPHRMTLAASSRDEIFGTLTLGLDTQDGLLADKLYPDEIGRFRDAGRRVCELSRFAVDPAHGSKEVLASIIQLAYIYLRRIHRASDAFIEVNPRHAPFYKRMIGFRQIGDQRTCPRVNAPAVLLHLDFAYMDEQVARHAGSQCTGERSLYPYFIPDAGTMAACA